VIIFELTNTEQNPIYQEMEISNGNRQYDFLRSITISSLKMDRHFLSQHIIKALNFHAIACLHTNPGEYRPCQVKVGEYFPPEHYRVGALMDDFVNYVNSSWTKTDPVVLSTYVLWRINNIHPFINGNGRTARAASYFVLCVKLGGWLPGDTILPELLRQNRPEYVSALQAADRSLSEGALDLTLLHELMSRLLALQINGSFANNPPTGATPDAPAPPPQP
jgi:Fic family protein